MSHEIRTPLNAILGYAQLLLRRTDLPTDCESGLQTIDRSGNHLLRMINEILDLSRIEAGRLELENRDFDLAAFINDLSAMFQLRCDQKNVAWRVEWLDDTAEGSGDGKRLPSRFLVHGDEDKLRHILNNLLSNAIKFTESGAQVTLRICASGQADRDSECRMEDARYRTPGESRISDELGEANPIESPVIDALNSESWINFTFEVIDTGVGISDEEQAKIFEPFQQGTTGETSGGTGLGLAIAQALVDVMGGQLGVSSEVGVGSRFFFTVPFHPATNDAETDFVTTARRIVRLAEECSVNALVVDDVSENRELLAKMLTNIGCEVRLAENGAQAVEMVKTEPPDIVFMDIRMPVMDGLEAAERILAESWEHTPKPKLVAVSASALTHERQRYFDAGFDAFIAKPIQAESVYDCLANLLHITYNFESQDSAGIDIAEVVLPADLLERLKSAAESYRITELTELLDEVRQTGEHGSVLADRLRQRIQTLDMPAILEILESVRHEGSV